MLEQSDPFAEDGADARCLTREEPWPGGVVLDQDDAPTRQWPGAARPRRLDLLLSLCFVRTAQRSSASRPWLKLPGQRPLASAA